MLNSRVRLQLPYQRPYIRRLIAEEKEGLRPRGTDVGDKLAEEPDAGPTPSPDNLNVNVGHYFELACDCSPLQAYRLLDASCSSFDRSSACKCMICCSTGHLTGSMRGSAG